MYQVVIDELVFEEDFKPVGPADQHRIIKAIRKKLTLAPQDYGRPLSGKLKGYWKLRVGPFRVVYSVFPNDLRVEVHVAGYRRDEEVYLAAAQRLGLV